MGFNTLIPTPKFTLSSLNAQKAFDYLTGQDSGLVNDHNSISGFIFDYAGEVTADLRADITDHYTEDNTVIQDHVALAPIRVTMRGLIGELRAGPLPPDLGGLLTGLQNSLTTINAYLPIKTPQAVVKASKAISQVQKVSTQLSTIVSQGKGLYNFFTNGAEAATRQAGAYKYLEGLWKNRIPFTVNTPFRIYKNMLIETLRAKQDETTKYVSDISVTMKEIRTATVTISFLRGAAVNAVQKKAQVNNGPGGGSVVSNGLVDWNKL